MEQTLTYYSEQELKTNTQQLQQAQTYFCYLFIKQVPEAWIAVGFMVMCAVLCIKAIMQFRRALKNDILSRIVKTIYIVIFIWCFLYLGKIVFSQIIFWIQYYVDNRGPQIYKKYSIASKFLFVIWFTGVFLMQILIILVPYNWMNFIIGYVSTLYAQQGKQSRNSMKKSKKYLKYQIRSIKFLKCYGIVRFFFFCLVIPFVIIKEPLVQSILVKTILCIMLLQSFLLLVILVMGFVSIGKNEKLSQMINQAEINTLKNQYLIIIASISVRVITDCWFVFINFYKLSQQHQSCYIEVDQQWLVIDIVTFILQGIFTYLLPIFVVIRIYDIQNVDTQLTDSLIIADVYFSNTQIGEQQQSTVNQKDSFRIVQD